jgi:hypothetical protein
MFGIGGVAAVAILGAASLTKNPRLTTSGSVATSYYLVFDKSGSAAPLQRKFLGAAVAELENISPDTKVTVMVMASETVEVYSDRIGDTGLQSIVKAVQDEFAKPDKKPGTNMALMMKWVADRTKADASDYSLRFYTDGADDFAEDPKSQKLYGEAAKSIRSDKHLKSIVFFGVKRGYREPLRSRFGSNIRILTPDQLVNE